MNDKLIRCVPLLAAILLATGAMAAAQPTGAESPRRAASPVGPYNEDDPYGFDRAPAYREGRSVSTRYDRSTRIVTGRVSRSTGAFGRKLRVRLDDGEERSIEAPRNVVVRRYSDAISVHEVRAGEFVRVRLERFTPEGTLTALRVEVVDSSSRAGRTGDASAARNGEVTLRGSVSSIDSRADILRIQSGGRRIIVHTELADLRDSRGIITLRELQNGDPVVIEGRRNGDEVYARSVTVQ